RLSSVSNGVSDLHSKTANNMWQHVENRSEIIAITNGVHRSTWVNKEINDNYQNKDKLWEIHQKQKEKLIKFVKKKTGQNLDKDTLLIGFARRAAPYKRGVFIFRDEEKIASFLYEGKIQLIFSGKAHPLDDQGKEIVAKQVKMARKYPDSVVFLENYDMEIAHYLVQGCDLWLNNPRKPKEACGTSGIKAAMNGVLNLSILDGWWPEVCEHGVNGWQIGEGMELDKFKGDYQQRINNQDIYDLKCLYEVLFSEVIPVYYEKHEKWVDMMQKSIDSTYDRFSAARMIKDYYDKMYNITQYYLLE
ncbi:MAG: alpha-glucan family phosphorylase, partial [Halothermotrichaceae bacterium]